jgi:hypothetical protein
VIDLNIEDVARLLMSENDDKVQDFIETETGRTFLIKEDSELYSKFVHQEPYLEKLGMPEGSMSLDQVVVFKDNINNLTVFRMLDKPDYLTIFILSLRPSMEVCV